MFSNILPDILSKLIFTGGAGNCGSGGGAGKGSCGSAVICGSGGAVICGGICGNDGTPGNMIFLFSEELREI
jgi:hypothetical protein